jgi:hypothetical protein
MLIELRYQVKIHTLSNQPREKEILQFLPIFFFNLKTMQYGNDIICKGKIKPVYAQ